MSGAKDSPKTGAPPLADLVSAGAQQTEAARINDFIVMVKDISNAYLVGTEGGDVLVTTGFMASAEKNKGLFAPHRSGPLSHIVLTQAHADHYGGVPVLREEDTQIIAGKGFEETERFFDELGPFLKRRSGKLWAHITRAGGPPPVSPHIVPDVEVADTHGFDVGNRSFEVRKVPGGESPDSVVLWMPDERIAFTGNLFGPVFGACPNLITVRGDKPRSVTEYLASIEHVLALKPDLLITGHGEPVRGEADIRATLEKMHRAVAHVNQAVIAGMNAGKTVYDLMRDIAWPDDAVLPEFHGKLPWIIRGIWEGYAGWMHYEDGTTMLYGSPRRAVDADLVSLAGADALAARAGEHVDAGAPLEAIHLADIVLGCDPAHGAALTARRRAHEMLLEQAGGTNLSETMWLKAEIAAMEKAGA